MASEPRRAQMRGPGTAPLPRTSSNMAEPMEGVEATESYVLEQPHRKKWEPFKKDARPQQPPAKPAAVPPSKPSTPLKKQAAIVVAVDSVAPKKVVPPQAAVINLEAPTPAPPSKKPVASSMPPPPVPSAVKIAPTPLKVAPAAKPSPSPVAAAKVAPSAAARPSPRPTAGNKPTANTSAAAFASAGSLWEGQSVYFDGPPPARVLQRGLALLIGIDAYREPINKLQNCVSDVERLAGELAAMQYTVTLATNSSGRDLHSLLSTFKRAVAAAEACSVVFWYAGHGSCGTREDTDVNMIGVDGDRVSSRHVYDALQARSQADGQVVCVFDCCRSVSKRENAVGTVLPAATAQSFRCDNAVVHTTAVGTGASDVSPMLRALFRTDPTNPIPRLFRRDSFITIMQEVARSAFARQQQRIYQSSHEHESIILQYKEDPVTLPISRVKGYFELPRDQRSSGGKRALEEDDEPQGRAAKKPDLRSSKPITVIA